MLLTKHSQNDEVREGELREKCSIHGRGKPEGKRPLERPRHRWENNIKMDLTEIWVV
jgi:hypothetical protein